MKTPLQDVNNGDKMDKKCSCQQPVCVTHNIKLQINEIYIVLFVLLILSIGIWADPGIC